MGEVREASLAAPMCGLRSRALGSGGKFVCRGETGVG